MHPSWVRELLSFFVISLHLTTALKFDLTAQPPASKNERCIRNFVSRDTLVVVTAILDGRKGDGQVVNMHVCGGEEKKYQSHEGGERGQELSPGWEGPLV